MTLPTFLVIETLRSLGDADKKPEATGMAERIGNSWADCPGRIYVVESKPLCDPIRRCRMFEGLRREDPEFRGRK